jgi:general secretion pathway protein K
MWVAVVAGMMLMSLRKNAWTNAISANNDLAAVQASWLARAGLEQSLAVLEDDDPASDGPDDDWFDNPDLFEDVELDSGTFNVSASSEGPDPTQRRAGLVDLSCRLNVNVADGNALAALEIIDAQQIDSILDWIDADDETRGGGAEAGYYRQLAFPYEIRNGPLQTPAEMMLIKGIDETTYYGQGPQPTRPGSTAAAASAVSPTAAGRATWVGLSGLCTVSTYDKNETAAGENRLSIQSASKDDLVSKLKISSGLADAIIQHRSSEQIKSLMELIGAKAQSTRSRPAAGIGGGGGDSDANAANEITVPWVAQHIDEICLSDAKRQGGKINVNTASREVLLTLPQMTPEAADAIITRRTSSSGQYTNVGQLLGQGMDENLFKAAAEKCCVRSNVFEVHSVGTASHGVRREITAIIDRGSSPMAILYWWQSE